MGLNKRLISSEAAAAGPTNTDNFEPVTYTGNGATQSISSLDFQPDLVWIKARSGTYGSNPHRLEDSVRGSFYLSTSSTASEQAVNTGIQSYNTNGFTVGAGASYNGSSTDYVAWCWRAAGYTNTFNVLEGGVTDTGSTASNVGITAGSNTNGWGVSANRDSGFSIVKYTGNGSNSSIGHGLNEAPELVIIKSRNQTTRNWIVHPTALGNNQYLFLNELNAVAGSSARIQSTTSTVVNIGTSSNVNANNDPLIMYCFHSVDGYQKIDKFNGDGNTSQDITTGFQPRFVILKLTSSSHWFIFDSERGTGEGTSEALLLNADTNGLTNRDGVDFTSTGFTVYDGDNFNASGAETIYLAIA
jgi:hypothetical protein